MNQVTVSSTRYIPFTYQTSSPSCAESRPIDREVEWAASELHHAPLGTQKLDHLGCSHRGQPGDRHRRLQKRLNEWMNFFAWQKNKTISQPGTQMHDNCVRLPVSWINNYTTSRHKLRPTDYVVKTQYYENKSCLVIKRTKTHTLNVTQRKKHWTVYTWSN